VANAQDGVRIVLSGRWKRGEVVATWAGTGSRKRQEVEDAIERSWAEASARLGDKLFDGPMCKLEGFQVEPQLKLLLSKTSYKRFLGTNLHNAWLGDIVGNEHLANAVGLSCALQTADGFLLLGKRNDSVAYYPGRVHPFAGSLEGLDVFEEMMRELEEEVSLKEDDVEEMVCLGMVEDLALRQPELVFWVKTKRTKAQIEQGLDQTEHRGITAVACEPAAIAQAMEDPELTPVAVGTLLLWSEMRRDGGS
jgi:hypothetical protein